MQRLLLVAGVVFADAHHGPRPTARAEVLPSERDSLPPAPDDDAYSYYGEYDDESKTYDYAPPPAAAPPAAAPTAAPTMERRGSRPVADGAAGRGAGARRTARRRAGGGRRRRHRPELRVFQREYSVYYDDNGVRMSKRAVEAAKAKAAAVAAAAAPLAPAGSYGGASTTLVRL